MRGDAYWSAQFPTLFREDYVGYADSRVRCTTVPAPDSLVSRLHLVAITDDGDIVVCRSAQGWRFLPGGTREPGESLFDLARRELLEEAGAVLLGEPRLFASQIADSSREQPYRPHLPHPRAHWAYAVAHVRVTGTPTNPADGEEVVEVLTAPPAVAVDFLAGHDPVQADLVRLADAMGLLPPAVPRS